MKKIGITSMYANPLHPGHIDCLRLSKSLLIIAILVLASSCLILLGDLLLDSTDISIGFFKYLFDWDKSLAPA